MSAKIKMDPGVRRDDDRGTFEDFLFHLQVERRMSAHTLDADRRDLTALGDWATEQGTTNLADLDTEQLRAYVAA